MSPSPDDDVEMRPLRRVSLSDQAVEQILELIADNGLRPGDSIPAEGELATRFGVNRLVIREAVRTLVAREVLQSGQGRPAVVTVPSADVVSQVLKFRLTQDVIDYEQLIEARGLLEGSLVRVAAARHKEPAAVAHLHAAAAELALMTGADVTREDFIRHDVRFHAALAHASGNQLLCLFLDALERTLTNVRVASYGGRERRGESHAVTINAHQEILDAVRLGRPDQAAAAMERHLAATSADLETARRDSRR
jgi:GntR family transcriptional repressor for pyruvate dehydrogenase complex